MYSPTDQQMRVQMVCSDAGVIRTRTFAVFALELEVVPLSQDHLLLVALCEHINKTLDRCSHALD